MNYLVTALFIASSIVAVLAAYSVFVFKDIMHVIVALALFLVMVSVFFLFLGQPLLAVLQLLIMVGGVATYFLLGSATAKASELPRTNLPILLMLSVLIFIPFASLIFQAYPASYPTYTQFTGSGVSYSQPLFYLMVITLFSISLVASLLFKKIGLEAKK